jgi:chromatin segregation and condensation protein Rec8/ScpA/Scc1 (kleisin family)
MIDYLRDQLATADGRLDGVALLERQTTASRRSCLFLGMLEMARDREVELQQDEIFGAMWVRRYDRKESAARPPFPPRTVLGSAV